MHKRTIAGEACMRSAHIALLIYRYGRVQRARDQGCLFARGKAVHTRIHAASEETGARDEGSCTSPYPGPYSIRERETHMAVALAAQKKHVKRIYQTTLRASKQANCSSCWSKSKLCDLSLVYRTAFLITSTIFLTVVHSRKRVLF